MTAEDANDQGNEGWSDEDIEHLLSSAILLGVLTVTIYFVVIRPILATRNEAAVAGGGGEGLAGQVARPRRQQQRVAAAAGAAAARPRPHRENDGGRRTMATALHAGSAGPSLSTSLPSSLNVGNKKPPHLASGYNGGPPGAGFLVEGLLPFRRSTAAGHEAQKQQTIGAASGSEPGDSKDIVALNRRSRARLFARLLNPSITGATATTPPPRGSNVVVCVPSVDVSCSKLQSALCLLGTYFNLFLVLCLPNDAKDSESTDDESKRERDLMSNLTKQLRGTNVEDSNECANETERGVPFDVLPDHRIVAARSIEGRVAFVRQIHRPEFVLDFDKEMRSQLGRFGFTVLLYGQQSGDHANSGKRSSDSISLLGKTLMPN